MGRQGGGGNLAMEGAASLSGRRLSGGLGWVKFDVGGYYPVKPNLFVC